jgi:hypothetical protein
MLEAYTTPGISGEEPAGAEEWRHKNFEPWGHLTVHVVAVDVTGRTAILRDCQDASTAGVANARTHQLIPGSTGKGRVHIRAEMLQGADGRWRLNQKELLETPCTPLLS